MMEPWCLNPHTQQLMFFILDPVHVLKSTRNALFSSRPGGVRDFWFDGKPISWMHIVDAYHRNFTKGLSEWRDVPNLTQDAIELTAWSKMRVKLAMVIFSDRLIAEMTRYVTESKDQQPVKTIEYLQAGAGIFNILLCPKTELLRRSQLQVKFETLDRHLSWFSDWHEDWKAKCAQAERDVLTSQGVHEVKFVRAENVKKFMSVHQTYLNLRAMVAGMEGVHEIFFRGSPSTRFKSISYTQTANTIVFRITIWSYSANGRWFQEPYSE